MILAPCLRSLAALALMVPALFATPALAELPPSVELMLREAGKTDKQTLIAVVRVAKTANPQDSDAIEVLGAKYLADMQHKSEEEQARAKAAEEARLAALGLLDGWRGQGEAGFGVTTGNTEQLNALIGVKLTKEGLKTRQNFAAALDYQQTDGVRSRERYLVSYGQNYLLRDGLYISTSLGWERDQFAGFARRFTESIGLGYRAISRPGMTLDVDGGPALRQTLYTSGFSYEEFGLRASVTYRWTLRPDTIFSQDASAVTSDGNATLISTSALTTKLSRKLSARVSLNVQSETEPQPGRKSTDTATRASLVYSF